MNGLDIRRATFVRHFCSGKSAAESARLAGYAEAYCRNASERLLKQPAVKQAIDRARARLREATEYDQRAAMQELDETIAFARETGNATAMARAVELKAKLNGLLVERREDLHLGGFQLVVSGIDRSAPEHGDIFED